MSTEDLDGPGNSPHIDDELSLPKATVFKMIQDILPVDVICAKETRDLLMDSCVEFIHLIASQANEICEKGTKKTITSEHILEALNKLGFQQYIEEVKETLTEHTQDLKSREKKKSSAHKFAESGLSQEELAKQQEELFKAARLNYEQKINDDYE